jgi:hypothetical protein
MQELPPIERWPEPRHVEVQHLGRRIYGLTVDGQAWIDPALSARRMGTFHAIISGPFVLLSLFLAAALWRRLRGPLLRRR